MTNYTDNIGKALAILKSLLPPTDYIVPVSVRKKIQEAYDLLSQSTHE